MQKCIRTPDIDEVGKTSRHGTFFQMNGNFSFGDYFKAGAIPLAWELSTKPIAEGGYGLDPERIWPTVYLDDDEAYEIWRSVGVPAERIVRRGKADNFWSMGIPGPCGPCSELFYDRGPEYGREGGPAVDEDRYMEYWNLVFMQFERGPGTTKEDYPILGDLPAKNIDTGMGLERMASILQGVDNLYEIDEVRPILARAAELTGKRYGAHSGHVASESHPDDVRLRVIADHVRTALMLIGDGVTPSQRGARLRAAPDHAPGDPVDPAAGLAGAGAARAAAGGPGLHGAVVPGAGDRLRPDRGLRVRGGGGVPVHPAGRHDDPGHRDRGDPHGGRLGAVRGEGVPAARHVRLPDRPDPGDRRRAGPQLSTTRGSGG